MGQVSQIINIFKRYFGFGNRNETCNKIRIPIILNEKDIQEKFVRGSGKGGQKINTTSNNVQIVHLPTGIRVTCQHTRSLDQNRKIARNRLVKKLDVKINKNMSLDTLMAYKIKERKRQYDKKRRKKQIFLMKDSTN